MRQATQGLVAAALAAVLIRISWTGEYLRFVQPWMRWPLLATGLLLLAIAIRPLLSRGDGGHAVPRSSWLLLLPTLIVFAVAPPPLGAYVAERHASQSPTGHREPDALPAASGSGPLDLAVEEFTWGAAQPDDVMGLTDQRVRMKGFVSTDESGDWYVTVLVIFCCAADVTTERVKVVGLPAPPRDTWVRVTGTWRAGTGRSTAEPATVDATEVARIPAPENPYS